MKTVLITGCSSGYGLATARYFHERGWRVIASMRSPRPGLFPSSDRLRILALDVTRAESIATAVDAAGPIDALVNNAGIGAFGAFEATPMAMAREIFETNTFGMMAVTQAVIPRLRARGSGVIVNVTSSATLAAFPLVAVYTASKAAIEGFTGSLALELGALGIRAKLVEPGYGPGTAFTQNSGPRATGMIPEAYASFAERVFAGMRQTEAVTVDTDVAAVVYEAVNDPSDRLRYAAGPDAQALAAR